MKPILHLITFFTIFICIQILIPFPEAFAKVPGRREFMAAKNNLHLSVNTCLTYKTFESVELIGKISMSLDTVKKNLMKTKEVEENRKKVASVLQSIANIYKSIYDLKMDVLAQQESMIKNVTQSKQHVTSSINLLRRNKDRYVKENANYKMVLVNELNISKDRRNQINYDLKVNTELIQSLVAEIRLWELLLNFHDPLEEKMRRYVDRYKLLMEFFHKNGQIYAEVSRSYLLEKESIQALPDLDDLYKLNQTINTMDVIVFDIRNLLKELDAIGRYQQ